MYYISYGKCKTSAISIVWEFFITDIDHRILRIDFL